MFSGEVYFHYTSELAFQNITHVGKAVAEVWASLTTEGPHANAWWGKGVYSVPLQPHQWRDRQELLDNNFRNMMRRRSSTAFRWFHTPLSGFFPIILDSGDREDVEKGPAYVDREYPQRAAFCLPIIIYPPDAYDVSKRATPEMVAAGKPPGTNLADRLLNEPGKPPRCCVVLRVPGEEGGFPCAWSSAFGMLRDLRPGCGPCLVTKEGLAFKWRVPHSGVSHARGRLLDALRCRADEAQGPARAEAKYRLGCVLWRRCLCEEGLPVAREAWELHQRAYGQHRKTFNAMDIVGLTLDEMGKSAEAEPVHRECMEAREKMLGREDRDTWDSMNNLALVWKKMGRISEAVEMERRALEIRKRVLGPEHPDTLTAMCNLSVSLKFMERGEEALDLDRTALEIRKRVLGPEHPDTLDSMFLLAVSLARGEQFVEAAELLSTCVEAMERVLGVGHPHTATARQGLEALRRCL